MFIEDCVKGIDMITHCDDLVATPINLGSSELVSVNELVSVVEEIAQVKLARHYELDAPKGVGGRNSDNTMIKRILGWEPGTSLREGMRKTYAWIEGEYLRRHVEAEAPREAANKFLLAFDKKGRAGVGASNQAPRPAGERQSAHQ
jgi:dTDP-D-glucose 4,6-dehydratase